MPRPYEVQEVLMSQIRVQYGLTTTLDWGNAQRGTYNWLADHIRIGTRGGWRLTDILIHEAAHAVHEQRGRRVRKESWHGPAFREILLEVVNYATNNKPHKYCWHREYKGINKWAKRNELHRQPMDKAASRK